jgi:FKBP-type peptidyl-prolyl cis-trans isomerase
MKIYNILVASSFTLLLVALFSCSDNTSGSDATTSVKGSPAFNLSFAYGAQLAKGLEQAQLTDDEKNVDKFVEGFQKGLEGDSASFAVAGQMIQTRMQSKIPSTTPEQAAVFAYNLGVYVIGSLALEVEIPESDFDLIALKDGFNKGVAKDSLMFSQPEMDSILKAYFEPLSEKYRVKMEAKKAKMEAKQQAAAAIAIEQGVKFLAENKQMDGIITTESGLQYEVIRAGSGPNPTPADQVKTHYHGTLIDGTIFDSSVDRGEPATFGVTQVIPGWIEGLQLMSAGAKYRFFIPQELAYGLRGSGTKIPGGSVLIFDLELIEIIKK